MQRQAMASVDGVTVLFTGPRLDQADLDAWEQALHLAKLNGVGNRIEFSAHSFLKDIGRATGNSQHEWLKNAFARLASAVVEIKDGKKAYFGALIKQGARDEESGAYVLELNPAIVALYGADGWTQIQREERHSLKKQPLAQWLHGFYATHAAPYPMKVETLYRLCGSEAKLLKHFRGQLKDALASLDVATGWKSAICADDLVRVEKLPTASQARHIKKKKL